MDKDEQQLEEMIKVDGSALTLEEIEHISKSTQVKVRYEKMYENTLYSTILLSLTHESFTEAEAIHLWDAILGHMNSLNQRLEREVGVPVATLDYLTNIKHHLLEPIIIEQGKSAFVSRATTVDELTGLYVRDVFDVILKKEVHEATRKNAPLSLLMIDIDDFKKVNDKFGHVTGDKTLTKVGSSINECIREMDLAARYGGEEFAVIMPGTNAEQAFEIGERIREHIERIPFDSFTITVSIGVSSVGQLIDRPEMLTETADQALYKAKLNGKNQVINAENTNTTH